MPGRADEASLHPGKIHITEAALKNIGKARQGARSFFQESSELSRAEKIAHWVAWADNQATFFQPFAKLMGSMRSNDDAWSGLLADHQNLFTALGNAAFLDELCQGFVPMPEDAGDEERRGLEKLQAIAAWYYRVCTVFSALFFHCFSEIPMRIVYMDGLHDT